MKVLICTITATGHVNPGIPISRCLMERGHEVRWYTSPRYRNLIESTGAQYLPLTEGPDLDETRADEIKERKDLRGMAQIKWDLKNFVINSSAAYVRDLRKILTTFKADVILCDMAMLAGLFVSELGGPQCVTYNPTPLGIISRDTGPFGMGLLPSSSVPGRLRNKFFNWLIWQVLLRDVNSEMNKVRSHLGLPPAQETFFDIMARRSKLYLQSGTPSFEYHRSDLPDNIRFIGPLLTDPPPQFDLPVWWNDLKSGKPVILVTQGTLSTEPDRLLLPTIQALKHENMLVIVTTRVESAALSTERLPGNVRLEKYIPYAQLMPHVDVMVTNGGYGGTLMALSNGVPVVGSGKTEDKAEVCQRISYFGAGINLKSDSPKPERIKDAVLKVLKDKKYKKQAQWFQKDFANYNAPTMTAELLEELTGKT